MSVTRAQKEEGPFPLLWRTSDVANSGKGLYGIGGIFPFKAEGYVDQDFSSELGDF
jgi:hypothetical protein